VRVVDDTLIPGPDGKPRPDRLTSRDVVIRIFEWTRDGLGLAKVRRKLNDNASLARVARGRRRACARCFSGATTSARSS
jgi:hypothetical protein